MNTIPPSIWHILRIGVFVIMFFNLAYLNFIAAYNNHNSSFSQYNSSFVEEKDSQNCGDDCVSKIYTSIYEATISATTNEKYTNIPEMQTKEYFVSFGSGTTSAGEWEDVAGLQAYIDTNNYKSLKKVRFEASVYIPTGNQRAYVRLYNTTDKHPVWFSEVSIEGGQAQLLISSPITLDIGNKLYSVQMKTSLKYRADLLQARAHIITE